MRTGAVVNREARFDARRQTSRAARWISSQYIEKMFCTHDAHPFRRREDAQTSASASVRREVSLEIHDPAPVWHAGSGVARPACERCAHASAPRAVRFRYAKCWHVCVR